MVLPVNAVDKTITWSIANGTGQASISTTGLVTALDNGTVIARATANDGSGVYGTLIITISNQMIPITGITVTGAGGTTSITVDNGTLQLSAAVLPANATNKTVSWSLINSTGQASISAAGLVTALDNGTVIARATASDGSGVYSNIVITINNQLTPVSTVTVTGAGGTKPITAEHGTLQLSAAVLPANATDKTVTWSLINGTGLATINTTGLVTALVNGTVSVRATANDGSGIYGIMDISIAIEKPEPLSMLITNDEIKLEVNKEYISWNVGVFDLSGSKLISKFVNSNIVVLNISSLRHGLYFLVLSNGKNLKAIKIIKP